MDWTELAGVPTIMMVDGLDYWIDANGQLIAAGSYNIAGP